MKVWQNGKLVVLRENTVSLLAYVENVNSGFEPDRIHVGMRSSVPFIGPINDQQI